MNRPDNSESGFVSLPEADCCLGSEIRDVEVLRVTKTNVIARGRRYGRQWLLKGLRDDLRGSAIMQRQLQKEFEINARLRHPSVVQCVAMENVGELGRCIVQEWVEGQTLHELLQTGKMKSSEKRTVVRRLVEAVAYLHSQGVVHRDLKPSNVMVREIGREVVLIDFGLADTADYVELKGAAGTPGFISPEQESSGGADPADDVYSLGVIMSEMTPSYSAIARRCLRPVGKRPADAGRLLAMIQRRDRRPKIIMGCVLALTVALLAAFAVGRIGSLERAAADFEKKVSELTEVNAGNVLLISSLHDSLASVRNSLDDANGELARISEYESRRQQTLKEGYSRIDRILSEADRRTFSKLTPDDLQSYTALLLELTGLLKSKIEGYCDSLKSTPLSKEDKEKIRADLYNYQAVKLSEYQNRWLKRINNPT